MNALFTRVLIALWFAAALSPGFAAAQSEERSEHGAYYEYLTWEIEIKGNSFRRVFRERIVVEGKHGDEYGRLSFSEGRFSKLKKLRAVLYDADGNQLIKKDKGDFTKSCGFDQTAIYSDICYYHTTVGAERYPYTINVEYVLECKTLFLWGGVNFQRAIPVRKAEYILDAPVGFGWSCKEPGLSATPSIDTSGSRIVCRWTETDIPALPDVSYLPPGALEPRGLNLAASEFNLEGYKLKDNTWRDIGLWYRELSESKYDAEPDPTHIRLAPSRRTADSLYHDLINSTRYVAIEIGLGGWQPYSAKKTLKRGFGDCKDLSTALISLFWSVGIEAFPVLVLTRRAGLVDPYFPQNRFNHVITVALIGPDTLWYDPTCSDCPAGVLPSGDENIDVLVATPEGGQLWRTPSSTPEDNSVVRTSRLHIDRDKVLHVSSKIVYSGNNATWIRGLMSGMDTEQRKRWACRQLDGGDKAFELTSFSVANLDGPERLPVVSIEAVKRKQIRKLRSALYCPVMVLARLGRYEKTELKDREYPLSLFYPDSEHDRVTVTWDTALSFSDIELIADDSARFDFGDFAVTSRTFDDSVLVDFSRSYCVYSVEPNEFEQFEEYRTRVDKIIGSYAKLSPAAGQ
jgi:hypothetical protein